MSFTAGNFRQPPCARCTCIILYHIDIKSCHITSYITSHYIIYIYKTVYHIYIYIHVYRLHYIIIHIYICIICVISFLSYIMHRNISLTFAAQELPRTRSARSCARCCESSRWCPPSSSRSWATSWRAPGTGRVPFLNVEKEGETGDGGFI